MADKNTFPVTQPNEDGLAWKLHTSSSHALFYSHYKFGEEKLFRLKPFAQLKKHSKLSTSQFFSSKISGHFFNKSCQVTSHVFFKTNKLSHITSHFLSRQVNNSGIWPGLSSKSDTKYNHVQFSHFTQSHLVGLTFSLI